MVFSTHSAAACGGGGGGGGGDDDDSDDALEALNESFSQSRC